MITNLNKNDIIMCVVPYKVYDEYDLFLNPLKVKDIIFHPHESHIKEVVLESAKLYHKPLYGHSSIVDTHIISFSDIQDFFVKLILEKIIEE